MTYLVVWLILFLFLAMAGLCWEMWKACRDFVAQAKKPERKSLDRYY